MKQSSVITLIIAAVVGGGIGLARTHSTPTQYTAAIDRCAANEITARFSELNADTPLSSQNIDYMNAYQRVILQAGGHMQAALMRNDLQTACRVVDQLEIDLKKIVQRYQ